MTNVISINPLEAKSLLDQKKALLVDVREDSEFQEERISGSIHLPLSSMKIDDFQALPIVDEQILIIHCRSGMRSAKACAHLQENNFHIQAVNLAGGIVAWQQSGLSVAKG
ncbi:MAG: rhodanese-like domain-containing protein [Alphaproteobacteria bacterium]|nr:rhodanese-like domain-containing protein [Alphaproteobacteria bacterium]OJV47095.1 MAG: hypothetical protein BGO28_01450 [Alphaproteobacteria bacterium 43-37]